MKKITRILSIAILVLLAVLFTGCPKEVDTVSVTERMNMFIEDANAGSYGNLKAHTHPNATKYNGADYDWWDTFFVPGDLPMSSLSISGTTATTSGTGITFTFTLQEDDKDVYKIRTITTTPSGHVTFE